MASSWPRLVPCPPLTLLDIYIYFFKFVQQIVLTRVLLQRASDKALGLPIGWV